MTTVPRARAFLRVLVTSAAGLFAASCVLLVAPATYGDRCAFEGEDTACGRCLRDRCQPMIDGCCKDDRCAGTLRTLESCALHGDGTCDELAQHTSSIGRDGELATCAGTLCGPVCRSFTGTSQTKCSESAFGRGTTCSCTYAPGAGNDFECSPETYGGTVCCTPDGWPASGLECSCLPLGCHSVQDGCACALVDTPPGQPECTPTNCCVSISDPDQCGCRPTCFVTERRVPGCSVTARTASGDPVIGCKKGQTRVATCSIRAGAGKP